MDALADAWVAGDLHQMVAAIEDFDGFSEQRAVLVAQTEATTHTGPAQRRGSSAVTMKCRWGPDGFVCGACQLMPIRIG